MRYLVLILIINELLDTRPSIYSYLMQTTYQLYPVLIWASHSTHLIGLLMKNGLWSVKFMMYWRFVFTWIAPDTLLICCQESGKAHKQFSSETEPTVWKTLPVIENFIQHWEDLASQPKYATLQPAIQAGLQTVYKYFGKVTRSSAQIIDLCECNI